MVSGGRENNNRGISDVTRHNKSKQIYFQEALPVMIKVA